jgi:hypothetical protein
MNLGQYLANIILETEEDDDFKHDKVGSLKEDSLPPMEYDSPYHDLVLSEMGEIDRVSEEFNIPAEDIQYAFEVGHEVILTENIWSKLENSDSYEVQNLDQAVELANKYKKNWRAIVQAIKDEKQLPLPMVMQYSEDKYHLVAGNTRLMIYKALGVQPVVLMANLNLKQMSGVVTEEDDTVDVDDMKLKDEQIDLIAQFIKYAVKSLGLHSLPSSLTLSYDTDQAKHRHTFGYFDPQTNKIWLYVKDRNVADILRTLAHEFVHRKQAEQGRIDYNSGDTGSEIENEANAMAGVLLRNFGKNHEDIYEGLKKKPINELSGLNSAYQYDDSQKSSVNPTYTFATDGGIKYKVIFRKGKEEGEYERMFTDYDNYRPGLMTKENKAIPIYATVTKITLDFLDNNNKWSTLIIRPISTGRYKVATNFIYNNIPKEKYNIEEIDGTIYITKK